MKVKLLDALLNGLCNEDYQRQIKHILSKGRIWYLQIDQQTRQPSLPRCQRQTETCASRKDEVSLGCGSKLCSIVQQRTRRLRPWECRSLPPAAKELGWKHCSVGEAEQMRWRDGKGRHGRAPTDGGHSFRSCELQRRSPLENSLMY